MCVCRCLRRLAHQAPSWLKCSSRYQNPQWWRPASRLRNLSLAATREWCSTTRALEVVNAFISYILLWFIALTGSCYFSDLSVPHPLCLPHQTCLSPSRLTAVTNRPCWPLGSCPAVFLGGQGRTVYRSPLLRLHNLTGKVTERAVLVAVHALAHELHVLYDLHHCFLKHYTGVYIFMNAAEASGFSLCQHHINLATCSDFFNIINHLKLLASFLQQGKFLKSPL